MHMPVSLQLAAATAALLAGASLGLPAAASAAAQPGFPLPPPARAAANPHCSVAISAPHLVKDSVTATGKLSCRSTVTDIALAVAILRDGRVVTEKTGTSSRGRTLTVTASRKCSNHDRRTFHTDSSARLRFKGHTLTGRGSTPTVTLGCGF